MENARVAVVCSSSGWYGTEKWVLNACEKLTLCGRSVTLVARKTELFSRRLSIVFPIESMSLRNEADVPSILKLAKLFREQADVAILTRVRDYWLGGLAAKLAGIPCILRLGVVRRLRDNYIMDRIRYATLPQVVLVNARAIRDTLLETPWMKPVKIEVIHNGVDANGPLDPDARRLAREQIAVPENELLIVGSGRFAVEKRWDWFVRAVAHLVEKGYPVTARLLGRGGEKWKVIEQVRQHALSTRFILPGERRDSHLWQAAADIVVLPSRNEGISNSMLEAMGWGVPVVATYSEGMEDIFHDGGNALIAEKNDFNGFLERLEAAVKDAALRKTIGMRGLETVRERFTWEQMTTALETLLDSLTLESS